MRKNIILFGISLIFILLISTNTNMIGGQVVYDYEKLAKYPWDDKKASKDNPFTALDFRKAMAMAFDYVSYLNEKVREAGFRLRGMIPKGIFGHHDTLLVPEYQKAAARVLFETVGWTGTIRIPYRADRVLLENALNVLETSVEQLEVGIEIELQSFSGEDFWNALNEGSIPILVIGWQPDYPDPDNYVSTFFHSTAGYFAPLIDYSNPNLDGNISLAARETNTTHRKELYNEIEEMAVEDLAWLYLHQGQIQSCPRAWLQGIEESGTYNPMSAFPNIQWINKTNGTTKSPQDTFIWNTDSWPSLLDPASNYEGIGWGINELTRETLKQYRWENTSLASALATNCIPSADGKDFTFSLREGVTFHDGSPFNAYVMKYSIDRAVILNDPSGPMWKISSYLLGGNYSDLENPTVSDALKYLQAGGVVALDEHTLRICQSEAYTPMQDALQLCFAISAKDVIEHVPEDYTTDITDDNFGQIPLTEWFPNLTDAEIKHYLNLTDAADLAISGVVPGGNAWSEASHDYMSETTVGTGPYKMTYFNSENFTIRFEKNMNWWGEFAPFSPNYVRWYGNIDPVISIQNLLDGSCDFTYIYPTYLNQVIDPDTKKPKEGLQHFEKRTFNTFYLGFNLRDTIPGDNVIFNGTYPSPTSLTTSTPSDTSTTPMTPTTTTTSSTSVANGDGFGGFELPVLLGSLFLMVMIILRRKKG